MTLTKQEQDLLDGIILDSTVVGSHQCEDVFNIQKGTTELAVTTTVKHETVKCDIYDDKDSEIDSQYQEIHDAAMTAYESIATDIPQIAPAGRSRANEVAAMFLNTALSAIKEKASHKHKKDQHVNNIRKIEKPETGITVNMSMADVIKQKKQEKGTVAGNIATPQGTQTPQIEDGEFTEDDSPPIRKMTPSQ